MVLREDVVSSSVKSAGYDDCTNELLIEFMSGVKYAYTNVPKEVYNNLLLAESKGKFVSSEVKGKFEYRRL